MDERNDISQALRSIMWAQFFLHLDFKLGGLDLLPAWAGWLLLYRAIRQMTPHLRDIGLLAPLCALLGAEAAVCWASALPLLSTLLTPLLGTGGVLWPVSLLFSAAGIYFNFQFFTDMARLAEQTFPDCGHGKALRRWRDALTCGMTALFLCGYLPLPGWILLLLTGAVIAATLFLVLALADLRRDYDQRDPDEADPAA